MSSVAIATVFGELNFIAFFYVKTLDTSIKKLWHYILNLWEIKHVWNMLTVDFFEKQFTL